VIRALVWFGIDTAQALLDLLKIAVAE